MEAMGFEASAFSVDVPGLLAALTEQFPEPLLCVRELIQNAADADAGRIDVEVSLDARRSFVRLEVRDDGRGMSAAELDGYLTIGFSLKDPSRDRGRFGVGKLSPYALGFQRMVVETSTGIEAHRITLLPDGSGRVERRVGEVPPRGTSVRVLKTATRSEAEAMTQKVFELVLRTCGSIGIPLFVNGAPVNRAMRLPTPYILRFTSPSGSGVIGVGAEPVRTLMSGGIVLESDAPILGPEVAYVLDGPHLAPTLSRNAVRRDLAFEALLQEAQARLPQLAAEAGAGLAARVEALRRSGIPVERGLEADDRAALEWLRVRLLDPDGEPPPHVKAAPLLETADGDLVSAASVAEALGQMDRLPISRIPRSRDEISGHLDRGIPVLLLYRDVEDFLDRQGIETVEVDGLDDGIEVPAAGFSRAERALLDRRGVDRRRARFGTFAVASLSLAALALAASALLLPTGSALRAASSLAENAGWIAVSVASGLLLAVLALLRRRPPPPGWLRDEAGLPVARPTARPLAIFLRALSHPLDFWVAKGWSDRGASAESRAQRPKLGTRLDLDRLHLGFVDLVSRSGDPSDARLLVRRGRRVLLNRNHVTVRHLVRIAALEPRRAQVLLEALLATDPVLVGGCDPRQVEWDLVLRGPRILEAE